MEQNTINVTIEQKEHITTLILSLRDHSILREYVSLNTG